MESAPLRSWWVNLLQGFLTVLFGLTAIVWAGHHAVCVHTALWGFCGGERPFPGGGVFCEPP